MTQSKKISIITPVYNRADCLPRCIDSVLRQEYKNWELILVDDGSKDSSISVAESYQKIDLRIRVFSFPQNRGTNAARNKAIIESTGDYLLILDSDDWLADSALGKVHDTMCVTPGFRHYLFQADDLLDYYGHNSLLRTGDKVILHFEDWLSQKVNGDFIHVIERSLMQAFPFDEETRILEGVNFMRLYKAGHQQLYSPFVITHRDRSRKDSVTPSAFLYNKKAMTRCLSANKAWLAYFTEDCEAMAFNDVLYAKRKVVGMLSVAMSNYSEYDRLLSLDKKIGNWKLSIVRQLHLGYLFRQLIFCVTYMKNFK